MRALTREVASARAGAGAIVELPAGFTHARLAGPAGGEPVVLIHGLTSASFVWDRTELPLQRSLRFDLYGRGLSARPRAWYDLELYLAQLDGIVAHAFGGARVALVGYSWGAGLTAAWAARRVDRVRQVVLVAPGGLGGAYGASFALLGAPVLGEAIARTVGRRALLADARTCFASPSEQPEFLGAFEAQLGFAGYQEALLSTLRVFPRDLEPLYAGLASSGVRVDVVWGTADRKAPFRGATRLRELIPAAQLHAIDGAEHGLMLEHAAIFNHVLRGVLASG